MSHEIFTKLDFEALLTSSRKGIRRQIQIAELVIEIIHSRGLEALTYELLSKKGKITRSLLYHYFPSLTHLLLFTSGIIRHRYQSHVVDRLSKKATAPEMLKSYIESALDWVSVLPKDAGVWMLFFHRCAITPELSDYNRRWVDMGTQRIAAMLDSGRASQDFQIAENQVQVMARQIQLMITGGVISRITEGRTPEHWQHEQDFIVKVSLEWLSKK